MTAYIPQNPIVIAALLGFSAAVYLIGLRMHRGPPRRWQLPCAWCIAIAAVGTIVFKTADEPPGVRMLVVVGTLLWSMKLVVVVASRLDGGPTLPPERWFAFLFGWPGMQPAVFAKPAKPNWPNARKFLIRGLIRAAAGFGLMLIARRWITWADMPPDGDFRSGLAKFLLLAGVSLMVHFGLFNLLAAGWQAFGLNCQPVFRAPLASSSLSEFWSRRWNLAFSEMTAIAVYRPCQPWLGTSAAVFAGFAFSGILHELAITVPTQAGYGWPMGYFVLHGMLVLLERRFDLPSRYGWPYRLWVALCVIGPLPWLFPPTFLREIVWPLVGIES